MISIECSRGTDVSTVVSKANHEFNIRQLLRSPWALRPTSICRDSGTLKYEDRGGVLLAADVKEKRSLEERLQSGVAIARAVMQMHEAQIVHRDIRPSNVFINKAAGEAYLIGFGVASTLRGEGSFASSEPLRGSFPYMAPEQTGRMSCTVDARADLYALGVTLFEILTGKLPFKATDPLEWIHCHTARTPTLATDLDPAIPPALAEIVQKLLSKMPEERYQSAAGLYFDLQRCAEEWRRSGSVESFRLGSKDGSARFRMPARLYGRARDLDRLRAALHRAASKANSEVLIISGYSGIGKSALVREFGDEVVEKNGLLICGKFDQYSSDIPYAPLAAAFSSVIQYYQSRRQSELDTWRSQLEHAMGAHGALITGIVPGLDQIVGDQAPIEDLSGLEAKTRFLNVFIQFVSTVASPTRPLVLFLDDLQWLDTATLEVFEALATSQALRGFLLVGAYRDNEVGETHPLRRRLEEIRRAGHHVEDISLGGIGCDDVEQMLADGFGIASREVRQLAELAYQKAQGNPFFSIQLVGALTDEGLVSYKPARHDLECHWEKIRSRKISENIATLMIERLTRLTNGALSALQLLACVGTSCDSKLATKIVPADCGNITALLYEPIAAGLLFTSGDSFFFSHDRVQEAAYALLNDEDRRGAHRRIGAILLEDPLSREDESLLFETASQLNRGIREDDPYSERLTASRANLRAGRKARASTAYKSAIAYLTAGVDHLGAQQWTRAPDDAFALNLELAECVFLSGNLTETERLASRLLGNVGEHVQCAAVHRLKVELHVVRSENELAVISALEALRLLGIHLPSQPSWDDVQGEYASVQAALDGRPFGCVLELPDMRDREMLTAARLLVELEPPAFFTDFNLMVFAILRLVRLSLLHGNPASAQGYALFGWILGPAFGRYEEAWQVAQLALQLSSRRSTRVDDSRVRQIMGWIASFSQPLSTSTDWLRHAYIAGTKAGDLYFSTYATVLAAQQQLMTGEPLEKVASECDEYLAAARRIGFQDGADMIVSAERAVACLRGFTASISDLNSEQFDQVEFERRLSSSRMPVVVNWYWMRKTMLLFLAGDFVAALESAMKAQPGPRIRIIQVQQTDYHLFTALAIAGVLTDCSQDRWDALFPELQRHHKMLVQWAAETGSSTYADKACLVGAEIARLEKRTLDAEQLYDESVRLARLQGFKNYEGIANQVAARFYQARGLHVITQLLLAEARQCFAAWGAHALVRRIASRTPQAVEASMGYREIPPKSDVDLLDLATVVKVSNALSKEMVLDKVVDTLMRTALENAGAERAVLLLARGERYHVEAEASTNEQGIVVRVCHDDIRSVALPESIVQYVTRTGESIVLDDATKAPAFWSDRYVRDRKPRSVVCLPLKKEIRVVGLLYIENKLFPRHFSSARLAILKLLASQAAISLENSYLYADLEARESRMRRLVESNVIGVAEWNRSGAVQGANDAFLTMFGYTRADLEAGSIRWETLTPPEWRELLEGELKELNETGALQPVEKEYFHKDGTRIPIIMGAAKFEGPDWSGLALIVDIRRQKAAEARAVEVEFNNRRLQSELAHANRVSTMGQIATWIAHDVKQPLVGVVASANAGLRWLTGDEPNIVAAKRSLERVVRDGHRANEVLDRVRALIKKLPPQVEPVDLNALIKDTASLIQQEASRLGINVDLDLHDVPLVAADRVQVQQVILNLVVNAIEALATSSADARTLALKSGLRGGGEVCISVSDSGPGLQAMQENGPFDAFYTTKSHGLGMGLAICKSIVESFGGKIWAQNIDPCGASFSFTLPVADAGGSR